MITKFPMTAFSLGACTDNGHMQGIDHYENFPVASWLCPAKWRPPIVAIYHFARTADDIADEGDAPPEQRLAALRAYRTELVSCYGQRLIDSQWPQVFGPLAAAIAQHQLPAALLSDLLDAFEQDVIYTAEQKRYESRAELLAYCAKSANPIGRLLLHLYQVQDADALKESDAICSALQLINFWQDRSQDMPRGRDYLPMGSDMRRELAFAQALMQQGMPLVRKLPGRIGWELRLVIQGGWRILERLHTLSDNQLADPHTQPRPKLQRLDVPLMLWRALTMPAR